MWYTWIICVFPKHFLPVHAGCLWRDAAVTEDADRLQWHGRWWPSGKAALTVPSILVDSPDKYWEEKLSSRFLEIIPTPGFRDILHWLSTPCTPCVHTRVYFCTPCFFSSVDFQAATLVTKGFWCCSIILGAHISSFPLSSVIHSHGIGFPP